MKIVGGFFISQSHETNHKFNTKRRMVSDQKNGLCHNMANCQSYVVPITSGSQTNQALLQPGDSNIQTVVEGLYYCDTEKT